MQDMTQKLQQGIVNYHSRNCFLAPTGQQGDPNKGCSLSRTVTDRILLLSLQDEDLVTHTHPVGTDGAHAPQVQIGMMPRGGSQVGSAGRGWGDPLAQWQGTPPRLLLQVTFLFHQDSKCCSAGNALFISMPRGLVGAVGGEAGGPPGSVAGDPTSAAAAGNVLVATPG